MKGIYSSLFLLFSIFSLCANDWNDSYISNGTAVFDFNQSSGYQNQNDNAIWSSGPLSLHANTSPTSRRQCYQEFSRPCVAVESFFAGDDVSIIKLSQAQDSNDNLKKQLEFFETNCDCKNLSEHIASKAKEIGKRLWLKKKAKDAQELQLLKLEQEKLAKIKAERDRVQTKSVQAIEKLNRIPIYSEESDDSNQTNLHDNNSWNGRLARRREAIIHVRRNQNSYEEKTYNLSAHVKEFVAQHGGSAQLYNECVGNQLQQVLHREFVEVVSETSNLSAYGAKQKLEALQAMIVSFSDDGCQQNKSGHIIKSLRFADLCWSLLEYGDVTIRAVIESTHDGGHRVMLNIVRDHAVTNLGQALADSIIPTRAECLENRRLLSRCKTKTKKAAGSIELMEMGLRLTIFNINNQTLNDGGAQESNTFFSVKNLEQLRVFFGAAKERISRYQKDPASLPTTPGNGFGRIDYPAEIQAYNNFAASSDGIIVDLADRAAAHFRSFAVSRCKDSQKNIREIVLKRLAIEVQRQQEMQKHIQNQLVELALPLNFEQEFDEYENTAENQELSQEQLKNMILYAGEYEDFWARRIAKRQALAEQLIGDETSHKTEYFVISQAAEQFLEAHDCDVTVFECCTGNEFQQALHQEFIEVISDVSQWPRAKYEQDQKLVEASQALLANLAQQGCLENKAGNIVESTLLADACKTVQIYGKAIALGVWDGIVDTAEILIRPDRAVVGLLSAGWFAASNLVMFEYDYLMSRVHFHLEGVLYEDQGRYLKHQQHIRDRLNRGLDAVKKAYTAFKETSGPERARFITRIATNVALHGKAIKFRGTMFRASQPYFGTFFKPFVNKLKNWGSRLFARIKPCPKLATPHGFVSAEDLQKLERTVKQESRLIKKLETQTRKIIKNAETYDPCKNCKDAGLAGKDLIKRSCKSCRKTEIARQKAVRISEKKSKKIFERLEKKGWELTNNGTAIKLRDIAIGLSESRFAKLRNFFGKVVRSPWTINGQRLPNQFNITEDFLRHLFMGRIKIYAKKMAQMGGDLSGFHHSYKWRDLQRKLFRLAKMEVDTATGVTKIWIPTGSPYMIEKTMFPAFWTPEKVVGKIIEALENLEKVKRKGDRLHLFGKTKCGIALQFVCTESGELRTAFPLIDSF